MRHFHQPRPSQSVRLDDVTLHPPGIQSTAAAAALGSESLSRAPVVQGLGGKDASITSAWSQQLYIYSRDFITLSWITHGLSCTVVPVWRALWWDYSQQAFIYLLNYFFLKLCSRRCAALSGRSDGGRTDVLPRRVSLCGCSFDGKMRINWFVINRSAGLLPCAQVNYTTAAWKRRRNC